MFAIEGLENRTHFSISFSGVSTLAARPDSVASHIVGSVSDLHRDALYRVYLPVASTLSVQLSNLQANATMRLIHDNNGNNRYDTGEATDVLQSENHQPVHITHTLSAGFYEVDVSEFVVGTPTTFSLDVKIVSFATPDKRDTAPNVSTRAKAISPFANTGTTYLEYVGGSDPIDWYSWNLTKRTSVNIRLNGLVTNADLALFRDANNNGKVDAGELLAKTTHQGIHTKQIVGTLKPGHYLFSVKPRHLNEPTPYALRIVCEFPDSSLPIL